ncbi:hypothetical protein KQI84_15600 [bacterium]|nr:hypothetical protein [bacterium]
MLLGKKQSTGTALQMWRARVRALPWPQILLMLLAGIALAYLQRFRTWHELYDRTVFIPYVLAESDVIFNSRVLMRLYLRFFWDNTPFDIYTVNFITQCIAASVALLATWAFAGHWLKRTHALIAALLAGGWTCWAYVHLASRFSYPYDFPALAFSALGLVAIVKRRYWGIVACIIIGGFNKESIFWLVPAWFFFAMSEPANRRSRSEWLRSIALGCLFVLVYLTPRLFIPQGDEASALTVSLVESDPRMKLHGSPLIVQNAYYFFTCARTRGFPWMQISVMPHVLVLLLWRRFPSDLRWLYAALPFFLVPTLIAGNVWELRIFNEILPLTTTAFVIGICRTGRQRGDC